MTEPMLSLLDKSPQEIDEWLTEKRQPSWRRRQIVQGIYRDLVPNYEAISTLPKQLRFDLEAELPLYQLKVVRELESRDDRTIKVLFELADGKLIETVLMLYPPNPDGSARATICVSTQAGCAFGCSFCATGQMGFDRHLMPGEIVAQVLYFARRMKRDPYKWPAAMGFDVGLLDRITNIVLMGMGEPLHNYDHVLKALHILNFTDGFNLGARNMTISTVGVVPGIERLANEPLQVNLAISLHAPNNTMRAATMPVARKWSMDVLLDACKRYIDKTGRQLTFEYILLAGINDQREHAIELGQRLAPFGRLAHVNLIPVNATTAEYRTPSGESIKAFREYLRLAGVSNSVRAVRGPDIAAACGQLKTREQRLPKTVLPGIQV